jgi:diaminopimelate epimerase
MLDFVHMSGAGNTFLVADGRDEIATLPPGAVRSIIEQHPRHDGASIEGVLILRSIADRTVTADFYNPDGSYGMMCGNGARCSVRYACDHGAHRGVDIALLLNGVSYDAICHDDQTVSVTFPPPLDERAYIVGELANVDIPVYYVNVNSDHVVIDGPRDAQRPVVALLRHHAAFPRGTNVSMVELEATDVLRIATFERGVEAVTGACGTGAISACIAWWRSGRCSDHVVVIPPSQRPLTVVLHHSNAHLTACTLRGDALYDNS